MRGQSLPSTRTIHGVVSSAIVSALHVLALAIGLPAIFLRGRALRAPLDAAGLGRLFAADNVWGLAALLWIVTGALRAFGGLEKGTPFYLHARLFWLKLGLFALVVALELWPMITFIRWRIEQRRGRLPGHHRRPKALRDQPRRDGAGRRDRLRRRLHGSRVLRCNDPIDPTKEDDP